MAKILKMLDLFSGIGGFSLAGHWAGFETIKFVEKNEYCKKVLNKHWPNVPIHDDITTFNFTEEVALMTGGFPCQPFSIAGKQRGRDDERYLWNDFYRLIRTSKPRWVIAENVPALIEMELNNIISDLERETYETTQFILPACATNAPHRRDRLWIIAHRIDERCDNVIYNRETRYFQENLIRNIEAIQSLWEKFQPESWETNTAKDWLCFNSLAMRRNDGVPERLDKDRIKALGNSIVPQLIFPFMKLIYEIENYGDKIP